MTQINAAFLNDGASGKQIAVIGAGVIGLAAALRLRRDGHGVSLYDPEEPGSQTSFGNAALIMTAQISPLSHPGVWKKLPQLLADPEGPLVVRWRSLLRLMPWFSSFLANSRWSRYERIGAALAPLVSHSLEAWRALAGPEASARLIRQDGLFYVFREPRNFYAAKKEAEFRRRYGIVSEIIPAEELSQMEPALAPGLAGGVLYPDSGHVTDPFDLSQTLFRQFIREGGHFAPVRVRRLVPENGGTVRIVTEKGEERVDEAVVAAGVWSPDLVRPLGIRPMLAAERGYHLTLPEAGLSLKRPLGAGDARFIITPLEGGIRLAGTAEFADRCAAPDWRRADILIRLARRYLPRLGSMRATRWMGQRPSTPDALPLIGRVPEAPRVICAFGHGHLGLTLAAVTSEIVSDIVAGRPPEMPVEPLRPARF